MTGAPLAADQLLTTESAADRIVPVDGPAA
jgi:hypothetical protein